MIKTRKLLTVVLVSSLWVGSVFEADTVASKPASAGSSQFMTIRDIGFTDDASVKAFLKSYGDAVWASAILTRYQTPCEAVSEGKCKGKEKEWADVRARAIETLNKYPLAKYTRFVYEVVNFHGSLQGFADQVVDQRHKSTDLAIQEFTENVINANFSNINNGIEKAGRDLNDFITKYGPMVDKFFEQYEKIKGQKIEM